MKTILAQLKKDAIALRPVLWAWSICVVFDCVFLAGRLISDVHLSPTGANLPVLMISVFGLMTVALLSVVVQMLLAVSLIVMVIHTDPLTEPDAFWRTRPISRGELLAAKASFAGLVAGVAILTGPAIGMGSPHQSVFAGNVGTLAFLAGVAALAAVTSSTGKVLLTFLGLFLGAQILANILVRAAGNFAPFLGAETLDTLSGVRSYFLGAAGQLTISALYFGGFFAVIAWQYLTLKTNSSRWALFALFFLIGILQTR